MTRILVFLGLSFSAWLFGCASSGYASREAPAVPLAENPVADQAEGRKVLYSAFLRLSVENPDSASRQMVRVAEKYEGYVVETGTYRAVIRVESGKFEAALSEVSTLGKVIYQNLLGEDVTEEYTDYQIRLENAEKARERYLGLLKQAETVEEVLMVERELERLNEAIDLLRGRMNRIDHLEEYATITVELREKKKLGLLGYIGKGVYLGVKWLFVRN